MKKIYYTLLFLANLLLFTACSSEKKEHSPTTEEPAIPVTLGNATPNSNANFATATGTLVAKNTVNVSTRMMGYITDMPVKVGQSVQKGQLLVKINATDIQAKEGQVGAQITQARTNMELAKKDYDRFLNLYNSQSATLKELDDMKARYDMAKAGVEAAQQMKNEVNAQYNYINVTAPISGVITAKFTEQGGLANPGMPLLTIEEPYTLQGQVLVSEQDIISIKQGMPVAVFLKSTNEQLSGAVSEITMSAVNTGGQYIVKINLPHNKNLLSGMFINAQFPIKRSENTTKETTSSFTIPKSALVEKGQLSGVYTVSTSGTALLRWLKLGKTMGEQVEVLSGLNSSEPYIVAAQGKLYNGAKVSVGK